MPAALWAAPPVRPPERPACRAALKTYRKFAQEAWVANVAGHNGEMDLSEALAAYDRVALNLDKLDRVWQRMQALIPDGAFIDGGSEYSVTYSQLAESWNSIAASLPAIDGWRLDATIVDYAAIGQTRVGFDEAGEWELEVAFKAEIFAPKTEALRYRKKLARARQVLVRRRAEELVRTVDRLLASVPTGAGEELSETEVTPVIHAVKQAIDEIERLLGDALRGGPRESDLYRHLSFGEPHDLRDIAAMDWPAFRPHVELALYDDEDPVPVHVDDLASLATVSVTPVSSQVHWDRIDADGFERLLARLLEQSPSYVRIERPMNVNAPDAGRDIQAYRRVNDGLVSERQERIIVQAKHRPNHGIRDSEIADLVYAKLPLWEGEPVRGLIVATTGSFASNAVRWVEDHNRAGKRPDIHLWSSNELEALLRKYPAVLAEFGLVD
jgi:hypothetical protein